MSSRAGWYPDPGGQPNTYRYWDGKAWSAATTSNPSAPPPNQGIVSGGAAEPQVGQPYGQTGQPGQPYGQSSQGYSQSGQAGQAYGQQGYTPYGQGTAYAGYQAGTEKKSSKGWWIGGAALLVVLIVVIVVAVRALAGAGGGGIAGPGGGQGSSNPCPTQAATESADPHPNDGRVHGGPLSYPELGAPWSAPAGDDRVPFGSDVQTQTVTVEASYTKDSSWVASVLVGRLEAGDGFYTPEQGSKIVVKCILGAFYGNNEVASNVIKDQAATVDGHDAWVVESKLTFDIPNLKTKGERLIVAIVSTGETSAGIYYASIPDTRPDLLPPAREVLKELKVDS